MCRSSDRDRVCKAQGSWRMCAPSKDPSAFEVSTRLPIANIINAAASDKTQEHGADAIAIKQNWGILRRRRDQ